MLMQDQDSSFEVRRQTSEFFDWSTFLITVLLVTIGLISIYSATYEIGMSGRFTQQLTFAIIGFIAAIVVMFLPERWISSFTYPFYGIVILMLIGVLLFGKEVNGTRGWLALGGFTFQPSEFAKLSTLMAIAKFLSSKGVDIKNLRDVLVAGALMILPAILIFKQPDNGTATVLGATFIGILFWSGFDLFVLFTVVSAPLIALFSLIGTAAFVTSVSIFAIIAGLLRRKIWLTVMAVVIVGGIGYSGKIAVDKLEPYQKKRIETFLNPGSDPRGSGYNVIQSILAVGSGGLSGKGFMGGTQTQLRYIPAQWTDFIFSVPAEEFGFLGSALVVVLIFGFILRAVRIASEVDSSFFSLIAFGSAATIFYHTIINIGMAIGMMPVMGIPLPFLSSGGSALFVNLLMLGILLNAYRSHRRKQFA
jgi:rod shape determining protein RodA